MTRQIDQKKVGNIKNVEKTDNVSPLRITDKVLRFSQ